MEPIPKPLLRRLVLTFLAGGGCFLIGLVFFLREGDMPFFTLSILLFLFSCGKGILLFLQVEKKAYTVLEGICTVAQQCQDLLLHRLQLLGMEHRQGFPEREPAAKDEL